MEPDSAQCQPQPERPLGIYQQRWRAYGEEIWSTTAITPQNTGVGVHYEVPKGDGAWFVSAGGGRCDLLGSAGDIEGVARAWAVTYKREVSGTITVSSSSAPAPGVNVEGDCNGGGMTATDDQGLYAFLVNKGPCTVTPRLVDGLKATPESRSFDVESNVSGVDFKVPCGAVPEPGNTATNGPRQPDAALIPAVSSGACLQVFIKIVGPIPNVGTRSGLSVDNYVPSDGPVNFTELTGAPHEATPLVAIHQAGQQCVSGCANILITVLNKVTHKPATDADVNVELGAIDTEEGQPSSQQGTQFVCPQTGDFEAQDCGTSLDGLKVDDNGQVRLLYWAPGNIVSAHVELYAQACTASTCLLKRAKSRITVEPYRIYHYQGELPPETVAALVKMVRSEGAFEIWSKFAEQIFERRDQGVHSAAGDRVGRRRAGTRPDRVRGRLRRHRPRPRVQRAPRGGGAAGRVLRRHRVVPSRPLRDHRPQRVPEGVGPR